MANRTGRVDACIKRAALYTRVSTEEQAMHGVSLEAQKERLLQYAEDNSLSVVDVYVDEGISARKRYTRRPEFVRMLEDVKAKKIDVILFVKLDRWFRNIADYYEVQAILDKYSVNWIATEEDYDTTTANGRLALNIKLAIAQDESDRTSERIKFAFDKLIKEGRVITGSLPLGYRIENKRAVIDEKKAPIAVDIFDTYIDTRSLCRTSHIILEKHGVCVANKEMKNMLSNRWYIGEAYGIKGWCPAIIDEKTFEIASNLIKTNLNRGNSARTERVYLFAGLIFCESCGRRMSTYCRHHRRKDGTKGKGYVYYRCPAHTAHTCDMTRQINQETLERWLIDNIKTELESSNIELTQKKKAAPRRTVDTSKIMSKIEKLKDLYLNDLIPKEIYEKDYRALSAQLEEAQRQQEAVERDLIDTSIFDNFEDNYTAMPPEARKAFWSRVIKSITVRQNGELVLSFNRF